MSQKIYTDLEVKSGVTISTINNATTDTDKFLVSDGGTIKFRTGTQVLSDIGGQAALINPVTGTGTTNSLSKFTGATTLGDSNTVDVGHSLSINSIIVGRGAGNLTTNTVLGFQALQTNSTGFSNTAVGSQALQNNTTENNTAIGFQALVNQTVGTSNVAIGATALLANTTGYQNVAVGRNALGALSGGTFGGNSRRRNTALGHNAGDLLVGANNAANNNVFIGYSAQPSGVNDNNSIVIGAEAVGLGSNTVVLGDINISKTILRGNVGIGTTTPTAKLHIAAPGALSTDIALRVRNSADSGDLMLVNGLGNVGIGTPAPSQKLHVVGRMILDNGQESSYIGTNSGIADLATTLTKNIGVGARTFQNNITGAKNVAVGVSALQASLGDDNVAIGFETLKTNTVASNSALGYQALTEATTAAENTAVGKFALREILTGGFNTALGYAAGRLISTGTSNSLTTYSLFLGHSTRPLNNSDINTIVIGASAIGIGPNTAVLGNDSIITTALKGNVGIGTTIPPYKLSVLDTGNTSGIIGELRGGANYGAALSYSRDGNYSWTTGIGPSGNAGYSFFTISEQGTVPRLVIAHTSGNVGIGTTIPLVKFSVVGVNGAESGTATPNGSISIGETGGNNQILTVGVLNGAGNHSWIQSRNSSTTSTYTLALNPNGGNVGIGTVSPNTKLQVSALNSEYVNLTAGLSVVKMEEGYGMYMGVAGTGNSWIQSATYDNSTTYPLILNGAGGNVGIGTTSPSNKLDVIGTSYFSNDIYVGADKGIFFSGNGAYNTGIYSSGGDFLFQTSGVEKMRLNSSGNLGIGTTSPENISNTTTLTLNGSSGGGAVSFQVGGVRTGLINGNDNYLTLQSYASRALSLGYNGNNTLVISTGNNVGIGTTSPTSKLHIWNGAVEVTGFPASGSPFTFLETNYNDVNAVKIKFLNYNPSNGYDSDLGIQLMDSAGSMFDAVHIKGLNGNFGIGTTSPTQKLDVVGAGKFSSSVQVGDDSATASVTNVGAIRYRTSGNNSYMDMVMQTGASTYAWVNVVQNTW